MPLIYSFFLLFFLPLTGQGGGHPRPTVEVVSVASCLRAPVWNLSPYGVSPQMKYLGLKWICIYILFFYPSIWTEIILRTCVLTHLTLCVSVCCSCLVMQPNSTRCVHIADASSQLLILLKQQNAKLLMIEVREVGLWGVRIHHLRQTDRLVFRQAGRQAGRPANGQKGRLTGRPKDM